MTLQNAISWQANSQLLQWATFSRTIFAIGELAALQIFTDKLQSLTVLHYLLIFECGYHMQ